MIAWLRSTHRHERALLAVQIVMLLLLVVRAGPAHPASLRIAWILLAHLAALLLLTRWRTRLGEAARLASAYPVALALYAAFSVVTPAIGFQLWDGRLYQMDVFLFGETPAVSMQRLARPWLTDVLNVCYLSYHAYLHGLLLVETVKEKQRALALYDALFTAFAVGYGGYLLMPAVGPLSLMPSAFHVALDGGTATEINAAVVARGGAIYDAFPSLHVLITCVLLAHDAAHTRRRFLVMLPVAAGLLISTVYLRYHYAVDLLAGAALFIAVRAYTKRPGILARQPSSDVTAATQDPQPSR